MLENLRNELRQHLSRETGELYRGAAGERRLSRGGPASGLSAEELVAKPVRMFLTAGDETQQVPDRSLFRSMVIRALGGEADRDSDRLVLGRELGFFVKNQVVLAGRARRGLLRLWCGIFSNGARHPGRESWVALDLVPCLYAAAGSPKTFSVGRAGER